MTELPDGLADTLAKIELRHQHEKRLQIIRAHGRQLWNEQGGNYDEDIAVIEATLVALDDEAGEPQR